MLRISRIYDRMRTLGRSAMHLFKELASSGIQAQSQHQPDKEQLRGVRLRRELTAQDPERIGRLVDLTGFFHTEEIAVAMELVQERLAKGDAVGYHFLLAEQRDRLAGYTCYGPIPCTWNSFDLYWIAVHPDFQHKGLGRKLVAETEALIFKAGGHRIYVETSQRDQYARTRAFYESCGYRIDAVLKDFYAPDDGKVIYCKVLSD